MSNLTNNPNNSANVNPNNFHAHNSSNFPSHSQAPPYSLNAPLSMHTGNPSQYMANGANDTYPYALSSVQIETLQNLIRQFKALGKRFSESCIPKLIEAHAQNQLQHPSGDPSFKSAMSFDPKSMMEPKQMIPAPLNIPPPIQTQPLMPHAVYAQQPPVNMPPHGLHHQQPQQQPPHHHVDSKMSHQQPHHPPLPQHQQQRKDGGPYPGQPQHQPIHQPPSSQSYAPPISSTSSQSSGHPPSSSSQSQGPPSGPNNNSQSLVQTSTTNPVPGNLPQLSLSWQCFHSLLLYGTTKNMGDNAISFPPSVRTFRSSRVDLTALLTGLSFVWRMLDASPRELIFHWY